MSVVKLYFSLLKMSCNVHIGKQPLAILGIAGAMSVTLTSHTLIKICHLSLITMIINTITTLKIRQVLMAMIFLEVQQFMIHAM